MIIPPNSLDSNTLDAVLENFITQEGTDYGEVELSLHEKLERLKPQVHRGEVLIVFDEFSETLRLITKEDYQKLTPAAE